MSQSTNDVYPTAVKVALHFAIDPPSAAAIAGSCGAACLEAKAQEFADVLKMGERSSRTPCR